jgi:carbonic anhydrase
MNCAYCHTDGYLKAIQGQELNCKAFTESAYQQEPTGKAEALVRQIPSPSILISSCAEQRKMAEEATQQSGGPP